MIRSRFHCSSPCNDQLIRTNQQKYQANKQALNRILSMKSLDKTQKYQIKYRQLKRTYNDLLTISQELEAQYSTIILNMQIKHKEEVEALKQVNEIQITKLKEDIKHWEIRVKDKEFRRNQEEEGFIILSNEINMVKHQNMDLLDIITDLKREKDVMEAERERDRYENAHQLSNIRGIMDKIDFLAKQLQLTKLALDAEKATSQLLKRELEQINYRLDMKNQQNSSLIKQHQIKNRTINDLQKIININQNQTFVENKTPQKMSSPRKNRIVFQIHQMIESYKRNIKNY